MTISQRIAALEESATLQVAALCQQLRAEGVDVIGLSLGEPDFPAPAHVKQAAIDAVNNDISHYGPTPGFLALREAIAASHMGMKVCGIACVTNLASGMTEIPPSHDEVEIIAAKSENAFSRLLSAAIFAVANVRKYVYTEEELMMPHI